MIPGAINIPVDEIRDRYKELTNKKLLVNCQVGLRGHTGSMLLKELGFKIEGSFEEKLENTVKWYLKEL
ncbi:MAG: hypothetical protein RLZZ27_1055 [Actinomycetota bacterium]